jgi:hypothetical protein
MQKILNEKKLKIVKNMTFKKEEPQIFSNFIGKNYVGYLIKNSSKF